MVPINPCGGVVVEGREISRDRVLSPVELGEAWRAAGRLSVTGGAFVRLAILTAQRRTEVAGMRWSEIADDGSTWTIPAARSKNRRAHVIHLASPARDILASLPRASGSDVVFSAGPRARGDGTRAITGFSDIQARLQAAIRAEREGVVPRRRKRGEGGYKRAAPVVDWTLHDFRRTAVTVMAGLGIAPHVADRILNHVSGTISGVAAVYQRSEFLAERRAALDRWAEYVRAAAAARDDGQPDDH